MSIPQLIEGHRGAGFSFEILPPLKGKGIQQIFNNIDKLQEFDPLYINITTHRSELVFKSNADGLYERVSERSRPGTVAVAAAIQQKYQIPAVPHLICSGFSKTETEYALIDLNFLGITNLLLLRGDKAKHENRFVPNENGHSHASELQEQVNKFNEGCFLDGTKMDIVTGEKFSYGVAGYPEKHDESPNINIDLMYLKKKVDAGADYIVTQMFFDNEKYFSFVEKCRKIGVAGYPEKHDESPNINIDLMYLKKKVDAGADYIVTQMFFDNEKYFSFVEKCRKIGINVPIIPGLKPITFPTQLNVLPKVFHVDLPDDLANELMKCNDSESTKQVGVEWCSMQAKELLKSGVPSIHFYSLNAVESVRQIAKTIY